MKIKICGITNLKDAANAVKCNAWAVGFVFTKSSPRYISPSKAKRIIASLPPFVTPVGVFVNNKEKAVKDICRFTQIKTVQFHGDEDESYCRRFKDYKVIKAFRVADNFKLKNVSSFKVGAYLFDTFVKDQYGGSGERFNWNFLKGYDLEVPYILSGGLNSENVMEALNTLGPYALDVSSGVEKSPGQKDPRLVQKFIDLANN